MTSPIDVSRRFSHSGHIAWRKAPAEDANVTISLNVPQYSYRAEEISTSDLTGRSTSKGGDQRWGRKVDRIGGHSL